MADLTVTEERRQFVDFTEPFTLTEIAAIIHKNYSQEVQTFSDLYYQTDVTYGMIVGGSTNAYFQESKNPIIRKMYAFIQQNPGVLVRSTEEGIRRANYTNYAFIGESSSLEFAANVNCDLIVINDTLNEFPNFERQYAFALKKQSKYLNAFNFALNEMNKSGELDELRSHYWISECFDEYDINSSFHSFHRYFNTIFILLFAIILILPEFI